MASENETVADIVREMREREDLNGRDMVDNFHIESGEYGEYDALELIHAYADRIEAALNRGVAVAESATTTLGVGNETRLRSALRLCMHEMCERCEIAAAAQGNPGPCVRGCETLQIAKDTLAAEGATTKDCLGVGDSAKLREALVEIRTNLLTVNAWGDKSLLDRKERWIVDTIDAALSTPPRNCDIVPIEAPKAADVFHRERPFHGYDYETHDWLLSTATEKEGGAE